MAAPLIIRAWLVIQVFTIRTPRDLAALRIKTFILAAVVAMGFLLIAAIIAHAIAFEGGAHPSDPGKRRLWFWVLLAGATASFFLYNQFAVAPTVFPNLQGRFLTINSIGTAITGMCYVLFGFVVSKMFSTGKLGNWFSTSR